MGGLVYSVNVQSEGGVPKISVESARLGVNGVDGDTQNDLRHHGGPMRAVCIYSLEKIQELAEEGHPIYPGSTGENLTIVGIDWECLKEGMEMQIGSARIKLTSTAPPCNTIVKSFTDGLFGRILEENYPGWSRWYASVIEEEVVSVGDSVNIVKISDADSNWLL